MLDNIKFTYIVIFYKVTYNEIKIIDWGRIMSILKVAVVGSCATRDGFNSQFVPNYKDFFKCVVSQNQMSMISLMADPIPFHADNVQGPVTDFVKRHFTSELEKGVIYELLVNQPDYIIIDFYADIFYGARQIGDSYITNKVWQFQKINVFNDLEIGNPITYKINKDNFFSLWKRSVDLFMKFIKEKLPQSKVIVNKARFTNEFIDGDGRLKKVTEALNQNHDIDQYNKIWNEMDTYIIEKYGLRYIDYGNKSYYSDPEHTWDLFYLHFTNEYYLDFRDKLLKIVFEDFRNEKYDDNYNIHEINLIKNSSFNYGKKYWTYWSDAFEVIENEFGNNSVRIEQRNHERDCNYQIWSNPIEINSDGNQAYTISFDVKINDLDELDSFKAIFSIRLYNKFNGVFQKDSVGHYNLKTNQFNIKENEWTRCSYTFKPFAGRFIKVGPYMFRNGSIEWRNIQLEKNVRSTSWKPGYNESLDLILR